MANPLSVVGKIVGDVVFEETKKLVKEATDKAATMTTPTSPVINQSASATANVPAATPDSMMNPNYAQGGYEFVGANWNPLQSIDIPLEPRYKLILDQMMNQYSGSEPFDQFLTGKILGHLSGQQLSKLVSQNGENMKLYNFTAKDDKTVPVDQKVTDSPKHAPTTIPNAPNVITDEDEKFSSPSPSINGDISESDDDYAVETENLEFFDCTNEDDDVVNNDHVLIDKQGRRVQDDELKDFDLSKNILLTLNRNQPISDPHKSDTDDKKELQLSQAEEVDLAMALGVKVPELEIFKKILNMKGNANLLSYKRPSLIRIEIPWKTWEPNFDPKNQTLDKEFCVAVDKSLARLDFPCSFNSTGKKKMKSLKTQHSYTLYGKCGGKCQTKFVGRVGEMVRNQPLNVTLETSGQFTLVQREPTGRELRGKEREEERKKLDKEKAYSVFLDNESKILTHRMLHNNHRQKTLEVLRKIRSIAKFGSERTGIVTTDINTLKERLEKDELFQSNSKALPHGYIHMNSYDPFIVTLHSPLQMQYATLTDLWFLDATGQISQDVNGHKVLLHAIVGKNTANKDIPGVPITEFLLNKSNTENIDAVLRKVLNTIKKFSPDYLPKMICCDFSFAYLHAISEVFNKEKLVMSINRSYDALRNSTTPDPNYVALTLCRLHIINAFNRNLKKKNIPDEIRRYALHGLSKIQEASTLQEFQQATTNFITVFSQKYLAKSTLEIITHDFKYGSMQLPLNQQQAELNFTLRTDDELEDLDTSEKKIQREQSKFYCYFVDREKQIQNIYRLEEESDDENPLYNDQVINVMRDVYFPYVNFWTKAVLGPQVLADTAQYSTAPVENLFKQLKWNIHQERKEDTVKFISEHAPKIQGIVNSALSAMVNASSTSTPKNKRKPECDTMQLEEMENEHRLEDETEEATDQTTPAIAQESWVKNLPTTKKSVYQNRHKKDFFLNTKNEQGIDMSLHLQRLISRMRRKKPKITTENHEEMTEKDIKQERKKKNKGESSEKIKTNKTSKASKASNDMKDERSFLASLDELAPPPFDFELSDTEESDVTAVASVPVSTVLPLVFKSGHHRGDETDFVTLKNNGWLGETVMHSYSQWLLDEYGRPAKNGLKQDALVERYFIRASKSVLRKDGFEATPHTLPPSYVFDTKQGRLFYTTWINSHFLQHVIDFSENKIYRMDSKEGHISQEVKNSHFKTMTNAINSEYKLGKNNEWELVELPVAQQPGSHECGPLTLANMEAFLRKIPQSEICNPLATNEYRNYIASILLKTNYNGEVLLVNFGKENEEPVKTAETILQFLEIREMARKYRYDKASMENKLQEALLQQDQKPALLNTENDIKYRIDKIFENIDNYDQIKAITALRSQNAVYLAEAGDADQEAVTLKTQTPSARQEAKDRLLKYVPEKIIAGNVDISKITTQMIIYFIKRSLCDGSERKMYGHFLQTCLKSLDLPQCW